MAVRRKYKVSLVLEDQFSEVALKYDPKELMEEIEKQLGELNMDVVEISLSELHPAKHKC